MRACFIFVVLASSLAACAGAPPPPKAPPKAIEPPKEDDAWSQADNPLVIDWPAPKRAQLQAELKRGGLVAVTYGEGGLQLLADCTLPGSYKFDATKVDEKILHKGSADVAIATVGQWTTPTTAVYAKGLPPACRTATHFVKAIAAGAFASANGVPGATARATDEVFDAATTKEGEIEACRAKFDPRSPPAGCRAPIRIELARVDPRSDARVKCEQGDEGACARWAGEIDPKENGEVASFRAKAVAMCKAGKANACVLAAASPNWKDAPKNDRKDVAEKGCALGSWTGCVDLARLRDEDSDAAGALQALTRACSEGDTGCGDLADRIETSGSKEEKAKLADLRAKACLTSATPPPSAPDCDKYAELRRRGLATKSALPEGGERVASCEQYGDCFLASAAQALGLGVPRDLAKARASWQKWCSAEPGRSCQLPKVWEK
jgi:hypothetical protein